MMERIRKILSDYTEVSIEQITPDTQLVKDLGINSLDFINLVTTLEDEFDFEIPDRAIKEISTVGDIVRYIQNNIQSR